jgi:hypothetical protein
MIEDFMMWTINPTLNFMERNCKLPVPQDPIQLAQSYINLFDSLISDSRQEEFKLPL